MSPLFEIFLIVMLLVCGFGTYFLLLLLANFSFAFDVLIAAGTRILSLIVYRFFASDLRKNPSAWLVFEWLIPGVLMAEVILAACGSAASDGASLITNLGFNSKLFDT
jgi:hypothetical protein